MQQELPPHSVRQSARARRITLRVTARKGLEIVVPTGTSKTVIQKALLSRKSWAEKMLSKVSDERQRWLSGEADAIPEQLDFKSVGTIWRVDQVHTPGRKTTLTINAGHRLLASGDLSDTATVRALLIKWCKEIARSHLCSELMRLSEQHGLPFEKTRIGNQKTRWGSCSARGTISLNYRLIFLEPPLVRHILLHELCHLQHMNHSPRFYNLLHSFDPDTKRHDAALRIAHEAIPLFFRQK